MLSVCIQYRYRKRIVHIRITLCGVVCIATYNITLFYCLPQYITFQASGTNKSRGMIDCSIQAMLLIAIVCVIN